MPRPLPVRHHYYRGYPADFTGGRAAARTFEGWTSIEDSIDLDQSALVLMHLPDVGLRPEVAWRPDCPRPDLLGTIEWVPRTMDLVTKQLPPLVEAARTAKLQIVHVTMHNWYAKDFPQRQRCIAELGAAPPPAPDATASAGLVPLPVEATRDWRARHTERAWRPIRPAPGTPNNVPDNLFPKGVEPRDNDLVCSQTWELHRLLSARGIVNLIYAGWALNWCLWFSPCGMADMERLRYQFGAVRGGCVAIENAQSADGEKHLEYAYWMTAARFGYLFDRDELAAALRAAGAPAKR